MMRGMISITRICLRAIRSGGTCSTDCGGRRHGLNNEKLREEILATRETAQRTARHADS
jgi:hypothetical protein